jgi:hypothetical protein
MEGVEQMRKALWAIVATMALLGGAVACGGSSNTGASSATTGTTSSAGATTASASAAPSVAPVITVIIANGEVTPTNLTADAKVGQPITLQVTSDAQDELHVHSIPDHHFEVTPALNQTFTFTVDVPGDVEVELHHLDRTIVTLHVRP